jgi:hypothetical protein
VRLAALILALAFGSTLPSAPDAVRVHPGPSGAPSGTSRAVSPESDPLDGSRTGAGVEDRSPAVGAPPSAYVPAGRTSTGERLLGREPLPTPAPTLSGVASWYAYVPGGAAAGPALRAWLGPDWRGQRVTVCNGAGVCVRVLLSDHCQCRTDPDSPKVIDLDRAAFAALADPSLGTVAVSITR